MVLKRTHEDKFKNGELTIGLCLDNDEISGSGYGRIVLKNFYFKKVEDHYENIREFGFRESHEPWGKINGCICFDGSNAIAFSDRELEKYVGRQVIVSYQPGDFKIWFKE